MAEDNKETGTFDDVQVKDSFFWIKDTRGFGSVTLTFMTVAFWITTIAYVLSMFEGTLPMLGLKLRPFDVGASASYLGIICSMYTHRKWAEAKYQTNK